jgi:hypothetical protein
MKLISAKIIKKCPTFDGIPRFSNPFCSQKPVIGPILSQLNSVHILTPYLRSLLFLGHPRSRLVFPTKILYCNVQFMKPLSLASLYFFNLLSNFLLSTLFSNTLSLCSSFNMMGAGIAQSVKRLATGSTTEGSEFESRYNQECSPLHIFYTGSGVNPTSYPVGTGGSYPGGKVAGTWSWPHTSN